MIYATLNIDNLAKIISHLQGQKAGVIMTNETIDEIINTLSAEIKPFHKNDKSVLNKNK
jgi:hypothetical protein